MEPTVPVIAKFVNVATPLTAVTGPAPVSDAPAETLTDTDALLVVSIEPVLFNTLMTG